MSDNKVSSRPDLVQVGRIAAVFGVKGWVKILSYTQPRQNIFNYQPWWLQTRHGVKAAEIDAGKIHGNGLVAHLKDVDDVDAAKAFCQLDIAVDSAQLPPLEDEELYWHQLEGLQVISEFEGQVYRLGRVVRLMETGANDVLVVVGDDQSVDRRERLIPYVPGQFVKSIDLPTRAIKVEWDPTF